MSALPATHALRPRPGLTQHLVWFMLVVFHPAAFSEHEADHRYTLSGYVLAADESPISGATVLVQGDGAGARGKTDGDGYYSVRLHLHNADLGRTLHVRTDHGEGTVQVTFDPNDRSTRRVHHVNIIGGKLVEGRLTGGGRVPVWLYYLTGLILLVMLAAFARAPLKRLTRRLRAAPAAANPKDRRGPVKSRARPKKRKRH